MRSKHLKIAATLLFACLLVSYGLTYAYTQGWWISQGVFPLVLIIVLVLSATIVHEFLGSGPRLPASAAYKSDLPLRFPENGSRDALSLSDYLALPIHGLAWLLVIVIDKYVSSRLKARRSQHSEILLHPH